MKTLAEIIKKKKKKIMLHCKVCGYDWESRVENPKECPVCFSRYWKTGRTPSGSPAVSIVKGDDLE